MIHHLLILIDCFLIRSISVKMNLRRILDANVSIHKKTFFDQPIKNKQKAYDKLVELSKTMIIQQETY